MSLEVDKKNSVIVIEAPGKKKSWESYTGIETIPTKGHFKDLPENEFGIDLSKYKGKFVITKSGQRVSKKLTNACKNKDVYIATDMDREGDAIGFFVYKHIENIAKNIYRVDVNRINKEAIEEGIKNKYLFKDISPNRFRGFFARRLGDRMVGYLLTPIASSKNNLNEKSPTGRVQTPAVRLIVDRDKDIKNFTIKKFWTVKGKYIYKDDIFDFVYLNGEDNNRFDTLDSARQTINGIKNIGLTATIKKLTKKPAIKKPQAPFITSTLQKKLSSELNMSPKKIMQIAQKLYEGSFANWSDGGVITYHRTDSTYVSENFLNEVRSYIAAEIDESLVPAAAIQYAPKASQGDAHEAIRPSDISLTGDDFPEDEKKVYQAIRIRMLASQMNSAKYSVTEIEANIGEYLFSHKSKVLTYEGFLSFTKEVNNEVKLPDFQIGDNFDFEDIITQEGNTKPPERFTEATLIGELERRGLGRPSTYASIISRIQEHGYVFLRNDDKKKSKKTYFHSSEKGQRFISFAMKDTRFSWVCDYDMTKDMENAIDDIIQGNIEYTDFLKSIHQKMGYIEYAEPEDNFEVAEGASCPCCGSEIHEREKLFVCKEYKYDKKKRYSTGCQFILWKPNNFSDGFNKDTLLKYLNGDVLFDEKGSEWHSNENLIQRSNNGELNKNNEAFLVKKLQYTNLVCPLCSGKIHKTAKQFVCENSKIKTKTVKNKTSYEIIGCKFRVSNSNKYFDTELNEDILSDLINGKIVKSDNGKNMVFDKDNEYFIIDKDYTKSEKKEYESSGVKCPKCKSGDLLIYPNMFKCSKGKSKNVDGKWQNSGCQFAIFKEQNFYDYDIEIKDLKLLANGESIEGNNGKCFKIDPVGKYSIVQDK